MADSDDPTNLKPAPQCAPESPKGTPKEASKMMAKEASTLPREKSKSKMQLDQIKKERLPSFTNNMPAFKSQPLLKLNHYSKNCSQADSVEDPADFVHKQWDYTSQTMSCSTMSVEPKQMAPPPPPVKTTPINRPEPPKVVAKSKSKIAPVKSKEKKKDDETNNNHKIETEKSKEKKDKDKEPNQKGSKKSKESNGSKSSSKSGGSNGKTHSKTASGGKKSPKNSKSAKSKDKDTDKDGGNKKNKKK